MAKGKYLVYYYKPTLNRFYNLKREEKLKAFEKEARALSQENDFLSVKKALGNRHDYEWLADKTIKPSKEVFSTLLELVNKNKFDDIGFKVEYTKTLIKFFMYPKTSSAGTRYKKRRILISTERGYSTYSVSDLYNQRMYFIVLGKGVHKKFDTQERAYDYREGLIREEKNMKASKKPSSLSEWTIETSYGSYNIYKLYDKWFFFPKGEKPHLKGTSLYGSIAEVKKEIDLMNRNKDFKAQEKKQRLADEKKQREKSASAKYDYATRAINDVKKLNLLEMGSSDIVEVPSFQKNQRYKTIRIKRTGKRSFMVKEGNKAYKHYYYSDLAEMLVRRYLASYRNKGAY